MTKDLTSRKVIAEQADKLFDHTKQTTIEWSNEYAATEAEHICNLILTSLDDCGAPLNLIEYWSKIKKSVMKRGGAKSEQPIVDHLKRIIADGEGEIGKNTEDKIKALINEWTER